MKKILLSILAILFVLLLSIFLYFQFSDCGIAPWSCGDYTLRKDWATKPIAVGSGPEDMAIDTSTGITRIIVSCTERREELSPMGGFFQINPTTHSVTKMKIVGDAIGIRPHGIDVVTIDSVPYLYAISHEGKKPNITHKIYRFQIKGNMLIADASFPVTRELLTGPNDLDVLEDGSFYVTNPTPSNAEIESIKPILGIKTGTVLHYDGKNRWQTVIQDMCYPNGVWISPKRDYLLVANGGCQAIERFEIENGKVSIAQKSSTKAYGIIPIGDNLMVDAKGNIWTAAHPCPLKFLGHQKNSADYSPSQVFKIDPITMKGKLVFQNNGELISAASTALKIGDQLYISQVFDPFVLVVDGVN
ncbi:MAG: SMP-30/gluconolactonase/LRE family protein [Bacteroidota bacterium]